MREDKEGKTAFQHIEGLKNLVNAVARFSAFFHQLGEDFRVSICLKDATSFLEITDNLRGIDKATLSCNGEITCIMTEKQGLDVVHSAFFCIGVLIASDAHRPLKLHQAGFRKDLSGKAEAAVVAAEAVFSEHCHSGSFLSAVLEGMEAEIDGVGCHRHPVYSEYTHNSI